jgi:hypothetical protein
MNEQNSLVNSKGSFTKLSLRRASVAPWARTSMPWCIAVCSFVALLILQAELVEAAEWKAGAAKRVITPAEPMWMSGYGNRDHAS